MSLVYSKKVTSLCWSTSFTNVFHFLAFSQQNQSAKHQAQMQQGLAAAKLLNQPSISITPLPRQTPSAQPSTSNHGNMNMKPGKPPGPGNKNSFVVCEICDSGIKVRFFSILL